MIIHNTSTQVLVLNDIPGEQTGQGLTLQPGSRKTIYNQQAEQSAQLAAFLTAGLIINEGGNEPLDGTPVGDAEALEDAMTITLGGDLGGHPGSASVNKVKGIAVSGTAGAGSSLVCSSTTAAAWGSVSLSAGVSGTLPIANGGTGKTTAAEALTNLGGAKAGANSDITSLSGLTTELSIAQGGTGAGTATDALTALGGAAAGANSDITSLSGLITVLSEAQGGTGAGSLGTALGGYLKMFTSAAGAGGNATEAMTLTGISATDIVWAVSQATAGANGTAVIAYGTLAADRLTVTWTADPGAGAVINVLVFRMPLA